MFQGTNAFVPLRPDNPEGYLLHHMESNHLYGKHLIMGVVSAVAAVAAVSGKSAEDVFAKAFHNGKRLPIQV